jgi:hypothetical protein
MSMELTLMDMRTMTDSTSRIVNTNNFDFKPIGPTTNPLSPVNARVAPDASTESEKLSATAPVMTSFAPRMNDMGVGTRLDFSS